MTLSNEHIQELIDCPKEVVDPPKRELKPVRGTLRNEFTLRSTDGEHEFVCFIRILVRFPENFSIGMDYLPKGGKGRLTLLRCNGDHGAHRNHVRDKAYFEASRHIHRATQEALEDDLDPDDFAEVTNAYASHEEALVHFLKLVKVQDTSKHFSGIMGQLPLFEEGGQG